jgi:hypothetical protein
MYEIPGGLWAPSVTNILRVVSKGDALLNWAAARERVATIEAAADIYETAPTSPKMSRPSYIAALTKQTKRSKAHIRELEKAGEIGTQAHAAAEWDLRGKVGPCPEMSPPALAAYQSFQNWRASVDLQVLQVETPVWSMRHQYAGTLDLYGILTENGEKRHTLIDMKTSKAIYSEALLQLSAYIRALQEMGKAPDKVYGMVLRLPKKESDPGFETRLIEPSEQDEIFEAFLAARQLWLWVNRDNEYLKKLRAIQAKIQAPSRTSTTFGPPKVLACEHGTIVYSEPKEDIFPKPDNDPPVPEVK